MSERVYWPAAERNRDPILEVLKAVLPSQGVVLEIASGTGQHAAWMGANLSALAWQPSDRDEAMFTSIRAWVSEAAATNVREPLRLDVTQESWPLEAADAVFNANMIHIAPWAVCQGLMRGAGQLLPRGGPLVLYGPFRVGGAHTAESNAAFDADLRRRDRRWGVRDLEAVQEEAAAHGLVLVERVQMPANNLSLVFRRE